MRHLGIQAVENYYAGGARTEYGERGYLLDLAGPFQQVADRELRPQSSDKPSSNAT